MEGVKVAARTVDPDDPPPADRYLSPRGVGCYLPCGLEVPDFPREDLYHIEWYVPIDEDHHYYTIIQGTVAETEEDRRIFDREVDEYLAKEIWNDDPEADPLGEGPNPGGFNNADAFGRDGIEHAYANENWWYRERLHKPDYTIIQWRMLVHRYARGIQKRGNFARLNEE